MEGLVSRPFACLDYSAFEGPLEKKDCGIRSRFKIGRWRKCAGMVEI
jgi:hypothetical protein